VGDGVLAADPVEHHLTATFVEAGGELLTVVGKQFIGHPVLAQGSDQGQADSPGGGLRHGGGNDAEPRVVVHPGDDLRFAAIGEQDPTDDVHLPQLHGPARSQRW
jgi:hypothetical protein